LGWGCGRTLEKVGICSLDSLDLSWGMVPRSTFGMICGVRMALKVAFSTLFGIARVKGAAVADSLEHFPMEFTREAHNWEVDVFASFFQVLHLAKMNRDSEDKLWWVSSKK
jgi:hypothetical protein